ncbi:MAG: methyltransferase domain-containing protein [Proteobacteria bacterium]|jgi:SAM-dependent methyltransferase|nr:methyltransferase domain-containing protein [Pseudomonadota bacterium]
MRQWYEELFTDYARTYDTEVFTRGTRQEVGFIEREIGRDKRTRILDVGCGTGRHAIELARRGYDVTGIDLSPSQLARAAQKAREAGVRVRFLERDARRLGFRGQFGLAIMLCEGGFSLMETDEMNYRILEGCARSLRRGGKLIFTALNALFPLVSSLKEFLDAGSTTTRTPRLSFDFATLRERSVLEARDDGGRRKVLCCDERFYVPSELRWMLHTLGFAEIGIFGCTVGRFSRRVKPSPKEFELLAIAVKG